MPRTLAAALRARFRTATAPAFGALLLMVGPGCDSSSGEITPDALPGAPTARSGSYDTVAGLWTLASDPEREWISFGDDGSWEAWGDWEETAGETIFGTFVQHGDSVAGLSVYGIEMSMTVRGDTLQMTEGARYVRAGR